MVPNLRAFLLPQWFPLIRVELCCNLSFLIAVSRSALSSLPSRLVSQNLHECNISENCSQSAIICQNWLMDFNVIRSRVRYILRWPSRHTNTECTLRETRQHCSDVLLSDKFCKEINLNKILPNTIFAFQQSDVMLQ